MAEEAEKDSDDKVEIRVRGKSEDGTLMALEMEEGSMSQGKQQCLGAGKLNETGPP